MLAVASLPTLEELRRYILETLCEHDRLDVSQTSLLEEILLRSDKPCGMLFEVRGPRMLKIYAVWAGEENRILFYDSAGLRFGETRLCEAPDPQQLAA
jgi:hypothetical protein